MEQTSPATDERAGLTEIGTSSVMQSFTFPGCMNIFASWHSNPDLKRKKKKKNPWDLALHKQKDY